MPTGDPPSMTTTSPGSAAARAMAVPIRPCAEAECGSEIPNWAYTYATRPEQSNPAGLSPPSWYGTPRYLAATDGTAARLKLGYGGLARSARSDGPDARRPARL